MDKCREAFHDHLGIQYGYRSISWELVGGEYPVPLIQAEWVLCKRIWNASHDRCSRIANIEALRAWSGRKDKAGDVKMEHYFTGAKDTAVIIKYAINGDKVKI